MAGKTDQTPAAKLRVCIWGATVDFDNKYKWEQVIIWHGTDPIYFFLIVVFDFGFFMLYFWEPNICSRFLIFAFWYLLLILYLYNSNANEQPN